MFHHPSMAVADQAAPPPDEAAGAPPRRVKLLCSFAGRILPRPSDGALRYVGGHTRIISLPKDVSFPELMARMAEVAGGPAALKYQLPDEDLDALVSVSCPEDLDNMMEEYDKLADASPEGSAKLRAFLFPANDPGLDPSGSADDAGRRYLDAVNGFDPPLLRRKDSASSHNSDEVLDSTRGMPPTLDTMLMPHDASRSNLAAGTNPIVGFPDAPPVALNATLYVPPPTYVDPQPLGIVSGTLATNPPINTQPFVSVHSYTPPVHVSTAPAVPVVSNSVKPVQATYLEGNTHRVRAVQSPMDQNYKAHQPLSQLPPLSPFHLQAQNVERYDLHHVPKLPQEGQMLRLEDCYLCQKALPHSHSDTFIQENGNGSAGSSQEALPMFYSHHSEDVVRQMGQQTVGMAGGMVDNGLEPKVESTIPTNQLGTYGLVWVPDAQYGCERQAMLKDGNSGHAAVLVSHGVMGFPGDLSTSYGTLLGNLANTHLEDPLQQQQQVRQNLVQPHYPVPIGGDVSTSGNTNVHAADMVLGISSDYARRIDRMMESLHINPPEVSGLDEQGMPLVQPNVGSPENLKPDSTPMVLVNNYVPSSQVVGNAMYVGNSVFVNPGMVSKENYAKAVDQRPPTSLDASHMHNLQSPDSNQISEMTGNMRPYLHNLERELEPPIPNERLLGMPAYSRGFDTYSGHNVVNKIPIDEASQIHSKNVPNPIAPPSGSNFPASAINSNGPFGNTQLVQEPLPSESLFSDQDPWKIIGDANFLPPKPHRAASKEPVISKDGGIGNHLEHSNGPSLIKALDEGGLQQPLNTVNSNGLELGQPSKGSAEERIKQDLQAVAEGVATSVLESSKPPVPVFYAHERKEPPAGFNKERGLMEENADSQSAAAIIDHRIEDIRNTQVEKINLGLPITDDIGRLQIIKNSDLEELRELGSGTFGTVYHGKWRGTDVAIKRINDRCFAGKPSEQDRARADFWNEACKLADLHHPNVVAFYGVVLDGPGGSIATVTEFMVNGSLRHALQRNDKKLDMRKRLIIAMDVAFGMEYLHGKNIVHFDLKSDNLLVNLRDPQRPICKVGDLGLSKVKCQTLISGGVRGTLPWMAPELLNGSSSLVSDKVDVFSFGIVMWELLTGEEPYADLHYGVIIGGIVSNTLRPPVPDSCDPEWRLLMEQCWSAEPSERPSFTEIASRLRTMAAALPQKGSATAN